MIYLISGGMEHGHARTDPAYFYPQLVVSCTEMEYIPVISITQDEIRSYFINNSAGEILKRIKDVRSAVCDIQVYTDTFSADEAIVASRAMNNLHGADKFIYSTLIEDGEIDTDMLEYCLECYNNGDMTLEEVVDTWNNEKWI